MGICPKVSSLQSSREVGIDSGEEHGPPDKRNSRSNYMEERDGILFVDVAEFGVRGEAIGRRAWCGWQRAIMEGLEYQTRDLELDHADN